MGALRLRSCLAAWRGEQQRQRAKGRLRELMASWRQQAVLARYLLGEIWGLAGTRGGDVEGLGERGAVEEDSSLTAPLHIACCLQPGAPLHWFSWPRRPESWVQGSTGSAPLSRRLLGAGSGPTSKARGVLHSGSIPWIG